MIDALGLRRPRGRRLSARASGRPFQRCAAILSRRREHRSEQRWKCARWSLANGLTAARAVISSSILGLAVYDGSRLLLVLGLLASWVGDMIDGHVARACRCETVLGAQVDGLADRLTAMLVVAGSIRISNGAALAVAGGMTVWLQFGILDHALSAQFLRHDRWSPDEFHLDDEDAWRMNWAPFAKVVSNVPVGLLALGGPAIWGALAGAAVLLVVRTGSSLRLLAGLTARGRDVSPGPRVSSAASRMMSRNESKIAQDRDHAHDQTGFPAWFDAA